MKEVVTDIMRYTFEHNADANILEVCATGAMDNNAFAKVAEMFLGLLKEHHCCKALIDYRELEFSNSTLEFYMRPQSVLGTGGTNRVKMAVLVRSINEDYHFLETVYVNRGFQVKMFTNKEDAMRWL